MNTKILKWNQLMQADSENYSHSLVAIKKSFQSNYFHTAIQINPLDYSLFLRVKGYFLDHFNKYDESIRKTYDEEIKINANDSVSWYNKGVNL